MAWWQLMRRCEFDGTARDPGYMFWRPDGWAVPPVETIRDPDDATRWKDVPVAVQVDDAVVERLSLKTHREGFAGHGYPKGDDDIVRPMLAEDWLAERAKINTAAIQSAGVSIGPDDLHQAELRGDREGRARGFIDRPADDHATAGASASSDVGYADRAPPEQLPPPAIEVEQHTVPSNPALPVSETTMVHDPVYTPPIHHTPRSDTIPAKP